MQPSNTSGLAPGYRGGDGSSGSRGVFRRSSSRARQTRSSKKSTRLPADGARAGSQDRGPPKTRSMGTTPGDGSGPEDGSESVPAARGQPVAPGRAEPPKKGRIVILVKPWCTVYVDGRKVGRSPSRHPIEVPAGRHRILCKQRPGDKGFSKTVEVRPGGEITVHGSLLAPCLVTIPKGRGTWLIDGAVHRPGTMQLPAGRHRVQVLLPGGAGKTKWVLFSPGGRCRLGVRGTVGCF